MTHSPTTAASGGAYGEGRARGPSGHLPQPPPAAPPWPLRASSEGRGAAATAPPHRACAPRPRSPAPPIGCPEASPRLPPRLTAGAANRAARRSGVPPCCRPRPVRGSSGKIPAAGPGGAARAAGAMSGLLHTTLSGLNSDSYCEISQYRDQHFRVRRGPAGAGRGGLGPGRAVRGAGQREGAGRGERHRHRHRRER